MSVLKRLPRLGKQEVQVLWKYLFQLHCRCPVLLILQACLGMYPGWSCSIKRLKGSWLLCMQQMCQLVTLILPQHSHICSQYPLGLESLLHGANTHQVYRSAPAAHSNSPPTNRAAGACQDWNGMSFPLPGSSVEYTGEMEGFVAGLGSTDTSLNSDYLAMLTQQSILEASGQFIWR